jgi:hypothetical protein
MSPDSRRRSRFVAIFVAVDPGLYHRGLMHLFPHRARRRAGEVMLYVRDVVGDDVSIPGDDTD